MAWPRNPVARRFGDPVARGFGDLVAQGFSRARALSARDAYALWASTYPPRPHNPLMEVEQSVAAPIIASLRPRRALDIGTGSGRYLPLLAATGARLVVGVDRSREMLESREDELPRIRGDACRLPFGDGSFDLLSASLMVGDVERLDCLIAEVSRVLARGGHLVYSDFHPLWANRKWRRTFRAADGSLCQLPYFPHSIGEHLMLLDQHSLTVRVIREPRIVPPRARYSLARHRDVPAVVVFHAVKRSGRAAPAHLRTPALAHSRTGKVGVT